MDFGHVANGCGCCTTWEEACRRNQTLRELAKRIEDADREEAEHADDTADLCAA